jgi:hypothetical protein
LFLEKVVVVIGLTEVVVTVLIFGAITAITVFLVMGLTSSTNNMALEAQADATVTALSAVGEPVFDAVGGVPAERVDSLVSGLEGTTMKVVVVPADSGAAEDPASFASLVSERTGGDTVVVVDRVAKDSFGVSSVNNEDQIVSLLDSSVGSVGGDGAAGLEANLSEVVSLSSTAPVAKPGAGGSGLPGELIFGSLIILLIACVFTTIRMFSDPSEAKAKKALKAAKKTQALQVKKAKAEQKAKELEAQKLQAVLAADPAKQEELLVESSIQVLRQRLVSRKADIPVRIQSSVSGVLGTLEELLPKWKEMASYDEQKFTVNRIITDYLPSMLDAYFELPNSYLARKKTAAERNMLNQLTILQRVVDEIQDGVYAGVEARIEKQGVFLESKFRSADQLHVK